MKLSALVKTMKPSPTLALAAKAKEMKANGEDVVALSVGEPDWNTLEPIVKVGIEAIQSGNTKYTPASGIPALKNAVAEDLNMYLNLNLDATQVSVTSGAKYSIYSALRCLVEAGDKVGIVSPFWVSYPTMVNLCGAEAVLIPTTEDDSFKLNAKTLEKYLANGLQALLINSPSNPTGMMYSKEELVALADVLKKYPDTWIISDDIYARLTFNGDRALHLLSVAPELADRTVMIDGASKSYSMTGWRVGWAVGPKDLINAMNNFQSQTVSCAANFSQLASIEAIKNCQELVKESVLSLKKRRDFFQTLLEKIPGLKIFTPDATFYFWVGIKDHLGKSYEGRQLNTSNDFSEVLLEAEKLVVVPGKEFGMDGYIRMSFAVNEETLSKAANKLNSFIEKLG